MSRVLARRRYRSKLDRAAVLKWANALYRTIKAEGGERYRACVAQGKAGQASRLAGAPSFGPNVAPAAPAEAGLAGNALAVLASAKQAIKRKGIQQASNVTAERAAAHEQLAVWSSSHVGGDLNFPVHPICAGASNVPGSSHLNMDFLEWTPPATAMARRVMSGQLCYIVLEPYCCLRSLAF